MTDEDYVLEACGLNVSKQLCNDAGNVEVLGCPGPFGAATWNIKSERATEVIVGLLLERSYGLGPHPAPLAPAMQEHVICLHLDSCAREVPVAEVKCIENGKGATWTVI